MKRLYGEEERFGSFSVGARDIFAKDNDLEDINNDFMVPRKVGRRYSKPR